MEIRGEIKRIEENIRSEVDEGKEEEDEEEEKDLIENIIKLWMGEKKKGKSVEVGNEDEGKVKRMRKI